MKRYIAICLMFVCALSLTGCAEVVSERYEIVPAVVTDARYTPACTQITTNGKSINTQYYPASGSIEIVCKGRNEFLYGVSYYDRFYDCIGDEVWAINRIRVYDNDAIKERVINLFTDKEQAERVLGSSKHADGE